MQTWFIKSCTENHHTAIIITYNIHALFHVDIIQIKCKLQGRRKQLESGEAKHGVISISI